jgi:tripartite ATP-independent transporter DctP family solute receptor
MKILATVALALLIGLGSCTDSRQSKSLKLAHGLDNSHPVHLGMDFMARRVAEKSGGKLTVEIYPNQQLGTERQCLELLQIGSLAMTKVSGAVMENFAPNFQVLGLPYIFRDKQHIYRTLDSETGRLLLLQGERFWLRGLTYFDAGQRSFYAKAPIRRPEDLAGKKIRVQESPTAMSLVKALGGAPTPVSWGELYTALQQGVVDGAENNAPSFYTSRHYEICKYYTLNEHSAVPDILVIGTPTWNRLSAQEQRWLQEAADEAKAFQRIKWQEAEAESLRAVEAAGVEIILPDKALFADRTRTLLEQYRSEPALYQLIQQIQAIP